MREDSPGETGVLDFRALYFRDFGRLTRLAYFLGADDPEDTVQEAFTRLYLSQSVLHDPAASASYLYTTVTRLVSSRRRHLAVVLGARSKLAVADTVPDPSSATADDLTVVALVRDLPTRQREVVVLRYWLDLSEREIAAALGISEGAVKTHAARARATLAQQIGHPDA